jgi:uncharacterized SAM-binding protein YcdF (DUF218 family)
MKNIVSIIILIAVFIGVSYITILIIGFYLSPQDTIRNSDAIVVISGGETRTRTIEGITLYQEGMAPLIIFSGDTLDPESPSNAEVMKDIAVTEFEIPAAAVITEDYATSTYENALNLKPVFENNNINSIILVTSPYHQRRSAMTFQYIMGPEFRIINHSSTDEIWRKIAWFKDNRAAFLTLSELWKIIYIKVTGEYQ